MREVSFAESSCTSAPAKSAPVKLMEAMFAKIGRCESWRHALIYLFRYGDFEAASLAELEVQNDRARGPLPGIPIEFRDLFDVTITPPICGF